MGKKKKKALLITTSVCVPLSMPPLDHARMWKQACRGRDHERGSHDEIRHIHRLFITVVGLDKTISIGLELAVVANHPSQHTGSRVCLTG